MAELDPSFITKALENKAWKLGNQRLYDLCAEHPGHREDDVILAKVWLIGRSYAAAIERRRKYLNVSNDYFYEEVVAPKLRASDLDKWLLELRDDTSLNRQLSLTIHGKLCSLLKCVTGLSKRSFASKYLHFHFPNRFFIYDSRAVSALGDLRRCFHRGRWRKAINAAFDDDYAEFFAKCDDIREFLFQNRLVPIILSPREFDKILLAWPAADPRVAEKDSGSANA